MSSRGLGASRSKPIKNMWATVNLLLDSLNKLIGTLIIVIKNLWIQRTMLKYCRSLNSLMPKGVVNVNQAQVWNANANCCMKVKCLSDIFSFWLPCYLCPASGHILPVLHTHTYIKASFQVPVGWFTLLFQLFDSLGHVILKTFICALFKCIHDSHKIHNQSKLICIKLLILINFHFHYGKYIQIMGL